MEEVAIPLPRSEVTPGAGREEGSDADLVEAQRRWRREWRQFRFLTPDMMDYCANEIRTGPYMWPGKLIASGARKGMNVKMLEVLLRWKNEGKSFTSSQLYQEAKENLIDQAIEFAAQYGMFNFFENDYFIEEDCFKDEYVAEEYVERYFEEESEDFGD